MKKSIKVFLFAGVLSISSISLYNYRHKYISEYEIIDSSAFATYRNGIVYIGDEEYISSIKANNNDILVIDERDSGNPNIKICDSYKVTDKDERDDIIRCICAYENMNPSKWDRNIESMRVEWFIHNMLYNIGYEVGRTKDVDFENSEEDLYNNKVIMKIFKI